MKHTLLSALMGGMLTLPLCAQNPIAQTCFSTDPAPMVSGDRLYVFTGHDEEKADFFWMNEWRLFSTTDMVNWTDHGCPLAQCDFKWADDRAWAPQCIERNGKFYLYVPVHSNISHGMAIGLAVADKVEGPYRDPLGKPLYEDGKWDHIDPTVMIDDDGQAYLFYGNNALWYTKLTKSMMAISGGEKEVNTKSEAAFGPFKGYDDNHNPKTNFEEASWIYKRNGKYYLEYAAGGVPEHWAYSTADKITGPWTYQGKVMGQAENSFTIHGGSVEYKGHHYMFYHNGKLPNGGGYKRATCVEEFTRFENDSIPYINFTTKGVEPLQTLNPFVEQEAETLNQSQGVKCMGDYTGCYVANISAGDYLKVRNVDFGENGAKLFRARVKNSKTVKGTLIIRIQSKSGAIKGRMTIESTNGEWADVTCELTQPITGVQNLFFTFAGSGSSLFDFDSWQFYEDPSAITTHTSDITPKKSSIFDLLGRKTKQGKGIRIVNGKKVTGK